MGNFSPIKPYAYLLEFKSNFEQHYSTIADKTVNTPILPIQLIKSDSADFYILRCKVW